MINVFITAIFAIISYQTFTVSTTLNALNRAILDIPISLFQVSVKLINSTIGEIYFDQVALEERLEDYFAIEIKPFLNTYELNYEYYCTSDMSLCLDDRCNGVRVNLKATVIFDFKFDKTTYYEITEVR